MSLDSLSAFQIDVLTEITNISAGTSISRLSDFLKQDIKMSVPAVKIVKMEDVFTELGNPEEEVYTIFSEFHKEIDGSTFFLFNKKDASKISCLLQSEEDELSILKRIGHIVSSSFVESLIQFSSLDIEQYPPHVTYDMLGAIIEHGILQYSHPSNKVFFIKNSFILNDFHLEGNFVFFPNPESLKTIFVKLGIDKYEK